MIYKFSRAGLWHTQTNIENQDAVTYAESDRFTVIALADGVSSCLKARAGAVIACKTASELLLEFAERFIFMDTHDAAKILLDKILQKLDNRAARDKTPVKEYSSTISCVLFDKKNKRIMCWNLGDSMILAAENGRCRLLAMPIDEGNGICTTTTYGALEEMICRVIDAKDIDSVAAFSDGAWRKIYAGNRLRADTEKLISESNYKGLAKFLKAQECADDFSFVSTNINLTERRESA